MINPYILESIIINISKKSLNCRLLSNTYKETVDESKFVYKVNVDNFFENEKIFGKFSLQPISYKYYKKMLIDLYEKDFYIKNIFSTNWKHIRFTNNCYNKLDTKQESKFILKYDMLLADYLKPKNFVLSENCEEIEVFANNREVEISINNTRIKKIHYNEKYYKENIQIIHYKVIETINIKDKLALKKKYSNYRNFYIDMMTLPNPNKIVYKNLVVITDTIKI